LNLAQTYEIWPSFGRVYAPGITHNLEHAFALKLPARASVTLSTREHAQYRWLSAAEALATVSSETNRTVIKRLS
jgi:dihydroneopterin triphosphate diphosphatase